MKKMLLSALAFLAISTTASAFVPQVEFFTNIDIATARVWNTSWQPIACSGYAFGRTYNGFVLNSYINNVVIYPGTYVDVYVTSNYSDPMIQAWAQMDCRF